MTQSPSEPCSPQVHATAGMLRGSQENGVAVFRGIPFAEPRSGNVGRLEVVVGGQGPLDRGADHPVEPDDCVEREEPLDDPI